MNIGKCAEKAKYLQKPYAYDYHYYDIQDFPDFMVHRDRIIDKPQNKACNNYNE